MVRHPRLDVPAQWAGYWWLPEGPNHTVPGILQYDPSDGLSLTLIGGFENRRIQHLEDGGVTVLEGTNSWPILLGVAERKEITLLDCLAISSKTFGFGSIDGPDEQTVTALTALIGVHLYNTKDPIFTESRVSVENLNQWAASSALAKSYGTNDGQLDGRGGLSVNPLAEPTVTVEGTTITLAHEFRLPKVDQSRGQTVGQIKDTAFIKFQSEGPITLETAQERARSIQDLVSFATHRASAVLWLILMMPREQRNYPEGFPVMDRKVAVYFQGTVGGDADAKSAAPHTLLFTCQDIPFEEIMPRWLQVRERFLSAINMVLGLRYAPARYLEGNLLSAVGSAEVMHRSLNIEKSRMPPTEFESLRSKLLENTPSEHRSWVKSVIRNDLTLRERLHDLAGLPDQEAMQRLIPDVEQWAKSATQARNNLAHTGQTPSLSIDELIAVVKVTSAAVVMNILQVLELPGERQREIVQYHPEIRQTARQASEILARNLPIEPSS